MKILKNKRNIIYFLTVFVFSILSIKALATWFVPNTPPPPAPSSINTPPPVNIGNAIQQKTGAFITNGFRSTALSIFDKEVEFKGLLNITNTGSLKLTPGAGANKVLTSDANGNATWQTNSAGGGAKQVLQLAGFMLVNSDKVRFNSLNVDFDITEDDPNAEDIVSFPIPISGTLKKMYVRFYIAEGNGSCNIVLRKNKSDTALVVSSSAISSPQVKSDLVHSVSISAGDILNIKSSATSSIVCYISGVTAEFDPN